MFQTVIAGVDLGSRRHGPIGRVMLGSTADSLAQDSPRPLLLIPVAGKAGQGRAPAGDAGPTRAPGMRTPVFALGLALVTLLLSVAPAAASGAARPADITGTLSERGMTVIAMATNGKATTVRARAGAFRIRPTAQRVTLHLRRGDGRYAGPIVMATAADGRRAILGVRAGTRLGRITVRRSRGDARVARRPAARRLDARLWARARRGVPVGARVFGRVRSAPAAVPGDRDTDGLPDPLDIDDDGDLVLDNLDRTPRGRARVAAVTGFDTALQLRNVLPVGINGTANANAGTTTAQADQALAGAGYLILSEVAGDTAELDCGLLTYCSLGGSGSVFGAPVLTPFPACCDADGDGLGTLARNPTLPVPSAGMFLHHGATTAAIKTGDVLIERVTTAGVETAYPATLQYVFATVPALRAYRDTAVPTAHEATVTYPVPYGSPGTPGARYGFPVSAGPGGDVVLRLTMWRPQRRHIEGEAGTGDWSDIGGLTYVVNPMVGGPMVAACPQDSLSDPGPGLIPPVSPNVPGPNGNGQRGGGFFDTAADRPADPANVISFTLNVTRCLGSTGGVWPVDTEVALNLRGLAANGRDSTEQVVGSGAWDEVRRAPVPRDARSNPACNMGDRASSRPR